MIYGGKMRPAASIPPLRAAEDSLYNERLLFMKTRKVMFMFGFITGHLLNIQQMFLSLFS